MSAILAFLSAHSVEILAVIGLPTLGALLQYMTRLDWVIRSFGALLQAGKGLGMAAGSWAKVGRFKWVLLPMAYAVATAALWVWSFLDGFLSVQTDENKRLLTTFLQALDPHSLDRVTYLERKLDPKS